MNNGNTLPQIKMLSVLFFPAVLKYSVFEKNILRFVLFDNKLKRSVIAGVPADLVLRGYGPPDQIR